MNHALLPSVVNASLPAKYEAATLAISECERIDECKDWSDKSAALASYAKQSGDKTLENAAMRIRARAVRRCGELLKEVEKSQGGRPPKTSSTETTSFTRAEAARGAGMTRDQAITAVRVANVPRESFEEQVESPRPATVKALAEQGRKPANGVPLYQKLGMTKAQFQAGMYFRGDVENYLEATRKYSAEDIAEGTEPKDRRALRAALDEIEKFNAKLKSKL